MKKLLAGTLLLGATSINAGVILYVPSYLVCKNNACVGYPIPLDSRLIIDEKVIKDGTYHYYMMVSAYNIVFAQYYTIYNDSINVGAQNLFPANHYPGNKWNASGNCPLNIPNNMSCPITDKAG